MINDIKTQFLSLDINRSIFADEQLFCSASICSTSPAIQSTSLYSSSTSNFTIDATPQKKWDEIDPSVSNLISISRYSVRYLRSCTTTEKCSKWSSDRESVLWSRNWGIERQCQEVSMRHLREDLLEIQHPAHPQSKLFSSSINILRYNTYFLWRESQFLSESRSFLRSTRINFIHLFHFLQSVCYVFQWCSVNIFSSSK